MYNFNHYQHLYSVDDRIDEPDINWSIDSAFGSHNLHIRFDPFFIMFAR